MANPDLVSDPRYALWCGVADFVLCGCLPYAEKGDVIGVSSMLNVGHIAPAASINGLASRQTWTRQWRAAPAAIQQPAPTPKPSPAPPARRTLEEDLAALVQQIQERLRAK